MLLDLQAVNQLQEQLKKKTEQRTRHALNGRSCEIQTPGACASFA